ncbi:MAG: hypothetical protein SGI73_03265 [Chloroflexota bacterium]|nr:hypothetical protein [Chloroflexota bacterium]
MSIAQTPQESFRLILLTVVSGAFAAAGYALEARPMRWAGGMFRFIKTFDVGSDGVIEFQLLSYVVTEFAEPKPSRFRVTLSRGEKHRTLSALVVEDFGVAILPDADHWWTYTDVTSLGKALAESGHLIIGYGIPWLAGDLDVQDKGKRTAD